MPKYRKFTQEYRDEAVLMVIQSQRPIAQVARELGINEGTLGTWLSGSSDLSGQLGSGALT